MEMTIEQFEDLKAYCNQIEYSLSKANTALREAQKIIEFLEVDNRNDKTTVDE